MANKLVIPAQAGYGAILHTVKTVAVPVYRVFKMRTSGAQASGTLTQGQCFPRNLAKVD